MLAEEKTASKALIPVYFPIYTQQHNNCRYRVCRNQEFISFFSGVDTAHRENVS